MARDYQKDKSVIANANNEALLVVMRIRDLLLFLFFEILYSNPTVLLASLIPFIQKFQDQF